ncbi:uncharacterized protein PHACADRAFT_210196 [Phanerochaete carnosa HHB-10118-sp]|uniref:GLTSCR protein conserved domain-containing protein n=1 Tax=Phanerochaete carnosa (strain HHB-10118-sp) TaxID=650164 RepID=K5UWI4_PHACS|nr:uncharacterized protein PHACADRAFT_210196 [Phanerochaete carnosa HHB-10118-sp]EKM54396.1 hypothetical protein PHACADRAFT_210196 [Phanerochaete carnosa HHB-10118-sp]
MSRFPESPTPVTPSTPVSSSAGPSTSNNHVAAEGSLSRTASTSEPPASSLSAPTLQVDATKPATASSRPLVSVNVEALIQDVMRRGAQKGRDEEEIEAMVQTAARVAQRIAADQTAALQPDTESAFTDAADAVRRLLPYHIFRHPAEDLTGRKGKRKATEEDLLREEIAETKFAIECWKRKTVLERKFRRIRMNEGKRRVPDDQAYFLAQAALEAERVGLTKLNSEYRDAKAELDRIEREKKAAAAAAAPPPPAPATPVAARLPYYLPPAVMTAPISSTFAASPTAYAAQYRNYTYSYSQPFGTPYSYTAPSNTSTSTAPRKATPISRTPTNVPVLQLAPPSAAQPAPQASSFSVPASGATTPVSAAPTTPVASMAPIPVHLPVSSLMSLSALGIVPIPVANAPPADQPQPACVLKGTTHNGTMVSLDINVSALGQAQASGLAVLLSALTATARTGVAAASGPAPATGGTDTSGTATGTNGVSQTASSDTSPTNGG